MLPCHIYMVHPDQTPPVEPAPVEAPNVGQERTVAIAEVFLCSSLPTQYLIIQLLAAAGVPPRTPDGQLSPPVTFALLVLDSIVLITLMVVLTLRHRQSPRELWLGTRSWFREAGLGLALLPLVYIFVGLTMNGLLRLFPGL